MTCQFFLSLPLQILGLLGANGFLEAVRLIVAGFALVLLVISLTAFRRTKARRLLFVSGAFTVVIVRVLVVENSSLLFPSLPLDAVDLLRGISDVAMLLLFFLAIVRR